MIHKWTHEDVTYTLNENDHTLTINQEVFPYSWSEVTPQGLRLYQDFAPHHVITIPPPPVSLSGQGR